MLGIEVKLWNNLFSCCFPVWTNHNHTKWESMHSKG